MVLLIHFLPPAPLAVLYPHEARLRNLTYAGPLYVDVTCRTTTDSDQAWEDGVDDGEAEGSTLQQREFVGYVPIMLRSKFCVLDGKVG